MNKNSTKNFKVFTLILLTSALLLVAINPNISSVKATTQDSVYVYASLGGTVSANGTSLTGGNSYNYNNGSAVNFTATAGTGFKFLDWIYVTATGGATSTANPFVYTVSEASCSIQAMFIPTSNLTSSSSSQSGASTVDILMSTGGTTVPAGATKSYTNYTIGTVGNFTAVPGAGFKFLYWIVVSSAGAFTSTATALSYNLTSSSYGIQAMFIPTSSTVTLPTPTPTVNEFSSAAAIIIVAILAISAFGTYTYTKKAKK
jgi:hypothetical protein